MTIDDHFVDDLTVAGIVGSQREEGISGSGSVEETLQISSEVFSTIVKNYIKHRNFPRYTPL